MLSRTPLGSGMDHPRDLYLTTHNTHNRQTSMSPAAFEPAIPTNRQLQTHALYCAAIGIRMSLSYSDKYDICF